MAGVATAVFVALAISGGQGRVVAVVFAVLLFAAGCRALLVGVRVEQNGIRLVNAISTKRIAWADIDRFEIRPGGRSLVGCVIVKQRTRPIPITAVRPGWSTGAERRAHGPIDELNELLATSQPAPSAPS